MPLEPAAAVIVVMLCSVAFYVPWAAAYDLHGAADPVAADLLAGSLCHLTCAARAAGNDGRNQDRGRDAYSGPRHALIVASHAVLDPYRRRAALRVIPAAEGRDESGPTGTVDRNRPGPAPEGTLAW